MEINNENEIGLS